MSESEINEQSKLKIVVWIVLAMIVEAVIVLFPLACALSGKGPISVWGAMDEKPVRNSVLGIAVGLAIGTGFGLFIGLVGGNGYGLLVEVIAGFIYGLIGGFAVKVGYGSIAGLVLAFGAGLTVGLGVGLAAELGAGLVLGIRTALALGLSVSLARKSVMIDAGALVLALVVGLFIGLGEALLAGLVVGFSFLLGVPLGILFMNMLRHLSEGVVAAIRGFFMPWRLKTYSFRRAIASFIAAYIVVVLIFSLWFYACYLEGTAENPYFYTGQFKASGWWNFVCFSSMPIAASWYGNFTPLHPLPQALVVLETLIYVGLVAVYIVIILRAARQKSAEKGV